MSDQNKIVLGSLLLTVCGGVLGAALADELRWRYADWRRRRRQRRASEVDLTGAKPQC